MTSEALNRLDKNHPEHAARIPDVHRIVGFRSRLANEYDIFAPEDSLDHTRDDQTVLRDVAQTLLSVPAPLRDSLPIDARNTPYRLGSAVRKNHWNATLGISRGLCTVVSPHHASASPLEDIEYVPHRRGPFSALRSTSRPTPDGWTQEVSDAIAHFGHQVALTFVMQSAI